MTPAPHIPAHAVDTDRLVASLAELVRIPSENPPGDEGAVAPVLRRMCEAVGLDVMEHEAEPGRPNLVARWEQGPGPVVCFCSHMDVVPAGDPALWADHPYAAVVRGSHMTGRGAADAKGPIAAALEAVAALRAAGFEPAGTLELALVSDEETMGFKGAGYLVERGVLAPDYAIVGEPTRLRVVRAQRGACWYRLVVRGVAGHGSAPERGVSAIRHMAEIVLRLDEILPAVSHPILGGPSLNVGTIRGGTKTNIVPDSCVIEIDRRTIPGETDAAVTASIEAAVERARKRFPELDASVELSFSGAPFEVAEDARVVAIVADAVAAATGAPAVLAGFRGASDARFLAEAGAEVVVLGPGDIAVAHTARESIDLEQLRAAAHAYALAFAGLLDPSGS